MKISVVIANKNGNRWLGQCISSILTVLSLAEEIIVVDDASTDDSVDTIKRWLKKTKKVRLSLNRKTVGAAETRNIGAKKATGEWLVFIDADTRMIKGDLAKLTTFLDRQKHLGGGVFKLLRMNTNNFDSVGEKITPFGFLAEMAQGAVDDGQFDRPIEIFSGKAAAMFVKRDLFIKSGGFDKNFFIYWEEPDFFWRIINHGHRVYYCPWLTFEHAYGTNEKKLKSKLINKYSYLGIRNQIWTIRKNASAFFAFRLLMAVILAGGVFSVLFFLQGKTSRSVAIIRGLCDGWWMEANKVSRKGRFFSTRVLDNRKIGWYYGKLKNYILGKPF